MFVSSITAVLVAWRLLPARWRLRRGRGAVSSTIAAVVGAFLAVSLGARTGLNAWLDDDVIDRATKSEVDGTDVWVIAAVVALVVLGVDQRRRRSR